MAGLKNRAPDGAQALARRAVPENLLVTQEEETMLNAPTIEQLHALKLAAMATAWTEQQQQADMTALAFDERFALLVEAEWRARENKRLAHALQEAKLKLSQAGLAAIDYPAPARARPSRHPPARHLSLGRGTPRGPHQRDDRDGEELPGLCPRAPGLPQGLPRPLSPGLAPLPRADPGARRWHLHPPPRQARPHGRVAHRRLGPRPAPGAGASRRLGDPRGSLRYPVDDHHQPAATRPAARLHR